VPSELEFFKRYTLENPNILFGRSTYESFRGRKLVGRKIHVLSSTLKESDDYILFRTVKDVLEYSKSNELVIAGGQSIYEVFLPYCSELVVSEIRGQFIGDASFPDYRYSFKMEKTICVSDEFTTAVWVPIK
jgi:dihydrofolate reductase